MLTRSKFQSYLSGAWDMRRCHPHDELNMTLRWDIMTESVLQSDYNRCVNPSYLPRQLNKRQISWRSSPAPGQQEAKSSGKASRRPMIVVN